MPYFAASSKGRNPNLTVLLILQIQTYPMWMNTY
jgi:hypothetical protein